MIKNRLVFVGVGQCGNNIANEFYKMGYKAIALNTSELDLKSLDIENKIIIQGANGCARDREKAVEHLRKNYKKVLADIEKLVDNESIVYLVFSLGGGTGSGMSPLLIELLASRLKVKVGAIGIVASLEESIQQKINTIETYNDLMNVKGLRSLYLVDNNYSSDKKLINNELVKIFDEILRIPKPNEDGVIDYAEIEKLLTVKGSSTILKFNTNNWGFSKSLFLNHTKDCKYIGISMTTSIDTSLFENEFGKPIDIYKSYGDTNIVISVGMSYPTDYFNILDKEIKEYKGLVKNNQKIHIDTSGYSDLKIRDIEDLNIDIEELLNRY